MHKAELRQHFLQKRKALTQAEVNWRSELISYRFLEFFENRQLINTFGVIHTFLPIQQQNEVDTWPIIRAVWEQFPQLQIAVSVTDTTTNRLTNYPLYPYTQLRLNLWGIPEPLHPDPTTAIPNSQFDLVLIPLLVFDQQGHRVGYGKGYYDRFLAECHPDCIKVGLSLFEPIGCISDVDVTDIRLNMCITPETVLYFPGL